MENTQVLLMRNSWKCFLHEIQLLNPDRGNMFIEMANTKNEKLQRSELFYAAPDGAMGLYFVYFL
jgi:hypothetical protein